MNNYRFKSDPEPCVLSLREEYQRTIEAGPELDGGRIAEGKRIVKQERVESRSFRC
jgi:hypothetical protein